MTEEFMKESLVEVAYENDIPINVTLELTTKCNFECKHCYIPEHTKEGMSYEDLKSLFLELRELGTMTLTFTGGEIFLRDDIFRIIELARSMKFRVYILSNASLLNKEKIIHLKEMNIVEFSTTIFSMKKEIHDGITQRDGSLDKILENVEYLKQLNIPVEIKTPLISDNKNCYKELAEFCEENGFRYTVTPTITVKSDGDNSIVPLRLSHNDLLQVGNDMKSGIIKGSDMIEQNGKSNFDPEESPCKLLKYSFFIDVIGDVYPCNAFFYKVGNVFESKVADIWYKSPRLLMLKNMKKKDLPECMVCDIKDYCERCPGSALLEQNDLFGCSPVDKDFATVKHIIFEGR